jgi:hypothetical protein
MVGFNGSVPESLTMQLKIRGTRHRIPPFCKQRERMGHPLVSKGIGRTGHPAAHASDESHKSAPSALRRYNLLPQFLRQPLTLRHAGCPILCGEAARVLQLRNKGWDFNGSVPDSLTLPLKIRGTRYRVPPFRKQRERMGHRPPNEWRPIASTSVLRSP